MIYIDKQAESKQEKQAAVPALWVLVLHMKPGYDLIRGLNVIHVLRRHLGLEEAKIFRITSYAAQAGKAVIQIVTKDVGETLMQSVNKCEIAREATDFKISLEQI